MHAIDSALAQTYENIEIIVVNDGSTDNGLTELACKKYGDKIKYFYKDNGGCASALNYGIKKSSGEYISWLSHDDLYSTDKIFSQVDLINKKNLANKRIIVSCYGRRIDSNGKRLVSIKRFKTGMLSPEKSFRYLFRIKPFNASGLLIPRVVFKDKLFDENFRYILDWKRIIEMSLDDFSFYLQRKSMVSIRVHGATVTSNSSNLYMIETKKMIGNLFELFLQSNDFVKIRELYYFSKIHDFDDLSQLILPVLRTNKIHINRAYIFVQRSKNMIKSMLRKAVK